MSKNIVITGEGILSAIGNDSSSVLDSLKHDRTGIGRMRYLDSSHTELPVGEVKLSNDEMRKMLDIQSESVSRTTLMAILAIKQALEAANIPTSLSEDNKSFRIVLISGTTVGGMDITEKYFVDMQTSDDHLDYLLSHDCGSSTEYISNYFGIFKE